MAKIDSIRTDLVKEFNGVWIPFIEGIELLIARARNPKYLEKLRELTKQYTDIDKINNEIFEDILKKVRAETILLGWKNIQDKDGKDILYSSEQALVFFKDPELKDFYNFVIVVSENADYFRKSFLEGSLKN